MALSLAAKSVVCRSTRVSFSYTSAGDIIRCALLYVQSMQSFIPLMSTRTMSNLWTSRIDEVLMIELQQRRDNLKLWWHHESANSDFLVLWNRLSQRAGWPHCKRCRSHTRLTHRYFLYIKVCYREKQCYDTHTFTFFTCLEWLISYRWKVNDFHSGLIVCLASFHMNDLRNLTCLPLSYRMII